VHRAKYSPIRVEADEATYDLHILLRFDIERRMLKGEIAIKDIPEAWNAGFEKRFGFRPKNNSEGCLQDIHWSMGGLGYFATYSLGNFNAAQLYQAAGKDPAVASACDQADYMPLLAWMRDKIHSKGALLLPAELIESATGEKPDTAAYTEHLRSRYL
jgi:carboxypeptidase Taq